MEKTTERAFPIASEVSQVTEDMLRDDPGDVIIEGDSEYVAKRQFDMKWEEMAEAEGTTVSQERHAFNRAAQRMIIHLFIFDEISKLEKKGIVGDEADELISDILADLLRTGGISRVMALVSEERI